MKGGSLTLDEIGRATGGKIYGSGTAEVGQVSIDSRTIVPGDNTLFVALKGERHNGHDYLEELYEHGIRAFMVSSLPGLDRFPGAGFLLVDNTLSALQSLAGFRRRSFGGIVAAVTGSNGKTIVKEWIYQCLGEYMTLHRSPKSYNSQVGVPLSVWMMEESHDLALIEAGISQPGEMEKLREIIRPQVGLFTHFGTAHQENFRNVEERLAEKLALFRDCSKVICRSDVSAAGKPLTDHLKGMRGRIIDWSLEGEAAYRYSVTGRSHSSSSLRLEHRDRICRFTLPFSDDASIENALHALTFSLEAGMPVDRALDSISTVEPVTMRLELVKGIHDSILINDTYNSDLGGLKAALDLMNQQDRENGRTLVLSDLLQSGVREEELYSEIAGLITAGGVDRFIGIGPAMMKHRGRFPEGSSFYPGTGEFLAKLDRNRFHNQTVLIKGSRKFGFEQITRALQLKTHQTVLETDLNAMTHNLNIYRSMLKEGVKIMVMAKAFSYGSGTSEIASLLQYHKVDALAVAFIDEGVELRKSGIHLPVMVLNPDPGGYGVMMDYRLEPEIYSFDAIRALYDLARYRGTKDYPIHIKLDTGMHRLGFSAGDASELIPMLKHPEFRVASVFTHLAASDDPDHDAFTREQIRRFEEFSGRLSDVLHRPFDRHVLNSSGIERFPGDQFEMVRLGIGLHGIGRVEGLLPVSSFRTVVSQVRSVDRGESVGYGREGIVRRDSRIATIPVGYADGFSRRLGCGRGMVWVGGVLVPTVGNICMDMTMIDVTGVEVEAGDPVEIFGRRLPVTRVARAAGTIPYEILTSVPARVKRVYLQE